MDNVTEYLLIQESKINSLIQSMKILLPNVQSAVMKGNASVMKKIAKRLPQKDMKNIKLDAIKQIPGFKENYVIAQKKIVKVKELNSQLAKPAAIAVALVSSTTKNSIDDVIKKGQMGLRNSKFNLSRLTIAGNIFPIIKLTLFITFIIAMYMTDGAVLIPTISLILKTFALLFSIISKSLSAASIGLNVTTADVDPAVIIPTKTLVSDPDIPYNLLRILNPDALPIS